MRMLLDTHILIWAITTPERLETEPRAAILDAANDVLFSAASVWKIAIKATLRRRDFGVQPDIVAEEARDIGFVELPIYSRVAAAVRNLPPIHRDPFDRLLVARAITEPAVLFTADCQLLAYSELVRDVDARRR